ncbi:MAG: TetR family transcriptional regulator [Alphaproteobacteria bacterium]|nr:TetR family transcriptional regulator [Alphaproteobacteria bacterium]
MPPKAKEPEDASVEFDLGRRELAKAERRLRILRAARDLIRETGDTDLSMRTLAQRADVSLSTPYNLFGSKRAVVLAVLEDVRDFGERFNRLKAANSIARIFAAHELAFGYYTRDPEFYRTLWRALLNTTGEDNTGLASQERLARTRAIWLGLVQGAAQDGYLRPDRSVDLVLRAMGQLTGGALLSWAMGSLATEALTASVGLGYALCLNGAATPAGTALLSERIAAYGQTLARVDRQSPDRSSETL